MLKRLVLVPLLVLLASLAFALGAAAQMTAGSGSLSGTDKLKVSGCGKDAGSLLVGVALASNGTFAASALGNVYIGTASASGSTVNLALSSGSLALLDSVLEVNASDLCQEAVSITALSVTSAQLKINKSMTSAKLKLSASGTGVTAGGSGSGAYSLKASGAWQAVP